MKTTQKQKIVCYIQRFGSVTSWEAYRDLGITQFATRIKELKEEGYKFQTEWEIQKIRKENRYILKDIIY